jgi:Domain of unknown function (DUF4148)
MKRTALIIASLLVSSTAFANDIDPFGFEKQVFVSTKSRAEVAADARQALAAGQISSGETVYVEYTPSTKSRTQVAAETKEAGRLGLLASRGELGPVQPSAEQEQQIRVAGLRAIGSTAAAD